jgi:hypothetical protein
MRFYRISGLNVASAFDLPGSVAGAADDPAEVVIRRGPVPDDLSGATHVGPNWRIAGARLLLDIPGIARFLLTDGREIVAQPETEARLADIPIFILGTVFGILLHQRGAVVLHAAAVRVGGRAVAMCGMSGAGKSTLAAALAERGHALVSDDLCAVDIDAPGAPLVNADGRQLRLWAQAINRLGLTARRGCAVRPSLQKFCVEPAAARPDPLPIGAIYVLREARPPHAAGIQPANVVDAALLVRRAAYRPLLIGCLGQSELYFRAAARIAAFAGVFHLTRPLDFADMPNVVSALEAHWADLGLAEAAT